MSPQTPTLHTPSLDSPDLPAMDAAAAALQLWDAVVIGAGPAGAMAALRLARQGARVLLVEKHRFPRPKVCGCCLNAAALELLAECGLADLTSRAGAQRLSAIELGVAGKTARLGLPTGAALSRERLDALLVGEAIAAGASFLPATAATVGPVEN
ncbi:MAG: FAD-dependent oxidoreductase, partial [Phycisphaerae bacterium]|nr:FAD-dependent oxidoreductase [Phycisphaerae bacterium]